MSTTLRRFSLAILKLLGIKKFRSTSGLHLPFIVHLGDSFGEMPYYNSGTHCQEILLMAAWCRQVQNPLILDVGGHVGFIATQLAQLLKDREPQIYSFEPVPYTFRRLFDSVHALGLEHSIVPLCAALSNRAGLVQLAYSAWDSMFAQVILTTPNLRIGDKIAWSTAVTLDHTVEIIGRPPDLVKLDAEGHEVEIFKGGHYTLSQSVAPALCFELNPLTLSEAGANNFFVEEQLANYHFYYISDFEHQRRKFGEPIKALHAIDWVCNVFGVPKTNVADNRWRVAIEEARKTLT